MQILFNPTKDTEMKTAKEILDNCPSTKIGLGDFYGYQTMIKALEQMEQQSTPTNKVTDLEQEIVRLKQREKDWIKAFGNFCSAINNRTKKIT